MKICNSCHTEKELTEFSKATTCKDGHRNYCKACQHIRKERWRQENKEHDRQTKQAWIEKNRDKSREIKRVWAQTNPEYQLEYRRKARKEFPQKYRAMVAVRRKRVQQATPPWVDLKELRSFYEQCPQGYHVDHIIPLKGEFVSGLHVKENLQYLPASDNMRKGNKYVECEHY